MSQAITSPIHSSAPDRTSASGAARRLRSVRLRSVRLRSVRLQSVSHAMPRLGFLLLALVLSGPAFSQVVLIPSEPSSHGPIPDGVASSAGSYGEPRDILFNVTGTAATVVDAAVTFSVDHTWVGDLRVTLIAPNGTPHTLFERTGSTSSNDAGFSSDLVSSNPVTFSDSASQPWWTEAGFDPIPGTSAVRTARPGGAGQSNPAPNTSLNEFLRSNPAEGTWILRFEDGFAGDTGEVVGAELLLTTAGSVRSVTSTFDNGPGTLRQALIDAQDGDMITFASPQFDSPRTLSLETALPLITETDLAIRGPGADRLTIRRMDGAPEFGILSSDDGTRMSISGVTLTNGNSATFGGGISSGGSLTLSDVRISGNRASSSGGGIRTLASGTLINVTIDHNIAAGHGGLSARGEPGNRLRLFNTTVSSNRATSFGSGGILLSVSTQEDNISSSLELINSTVVNNRGVFVGGGFADAFSFLGTARATITARNSIIANNSPRNLASQTTIVFGDGSADIELKGFNLSDDFNGFTTQATDITADPRLGPLALQGGTTPVHIPLGGSPAIDSGNRLGQTRDQRGQTKPLVGADIGAVEVQSLLVSNANDAGAGSLRAAITAANANGPELDDILFDPQVFANPRAIFLQSPLPVIDSSLTINGPRADLLEVVRESGAPDMSIFETSFTPDILALSGMKLTNGRAAEFGGGVFSLSNLSLTGMHLTDNEAGVGGGVYLAFSNGIIQNSTIAFNTAEQSGGIQFQGDDENVLQIINSTISSNTAALVPAILNTGTGTIFLVNSTVASNQGPAGSLAAVATTDDSEINLRNTLLANNEPFNLEIIGPASFIRSRGFNLSDDSSESVFLDQPSDLVDVIAGIGPLFNFGGPTPVHALTIDSNAFDAGNNSGSGVFDDQRGEAFERTVDLSVANMTGSDGTDIGAYEAPSLPPLAQYTPSVINLSVPFDGLAIQTLQINNVGSGPLNAVATTASLDCNLPTPWLTVSPGAFGPIEPGNTQGALVQLDPSVGNGLAPGTYEFALCIESNEPAQPERLIPVNVTIEGADQLVFRDGFENF